MWLNGESLTNLRVANPNPGTRTRHASRCGSQSASPCPDPRQKKTQGRQTLRLPLHSLRRPPEDRGLPTQSGAHTQLADPRTRPIPPMAGRCPLPNTPPPRYLTDVCAAATWTSPANVVSTTPPRRTNWVPASPSPLRHSFTTANSHALSNSGGEESDIDPNDDDEDDEGTHPSHVISMALTYRTLTTQTSTDKSAISS
jgi:hypothetical protein